MKYPKKLLFVLLGFFMASPLHAQNISYADLLSRPMPRATQRLPYGADPQQFGDLWLPKTAGDHSVIILLHGGCWQVSLPGLELMSLLAQNLRDDGFAVWNLEYRRLGNAGGGYPGTFLDIANGIDFLRGIAVSNHLDLSHVLVIGHSAGGSLGLWAAGRNHLPTTTPLFMPHPLPIDKVIALAGIDDLQAYRDKGPSACGGPATIDNLVGIPGRPPQTAYADTSPAQMPAIDPKQKIISGSLDGIVPASFGDDYAAKAQSKNQDATAMTLSDAGHFDLIDPTSQAWAQIKRAFITPLTK